MKSIYLDYAASTPVDPRVAERMNHFLTLDGHFGNPASTHRRGAESRREVEMQRKNVADLIGASPEEIIWTSGATESDNLAIKGVMYGNHDRGRHVVTISTEHKAVLDPCGHLANKGFEITYLRPMSTGLIDLDDLRRSIRSDTVLLSAMHVNNETGIVADIRAIGAVAKEKGVFFHVDAAQSVGKLPINVKELGVDLLSLSAHKVYGPKGIGALYVSRRPRVRLEALIHGGGHEGGRRSGTLATHQIVGMGEACRIANCRMKSDVDRLHRLRQRLLSRLSHIEGMTVNVDPANSYPGIVNVRIDGVAVKELMKSMPHCFSAGSACTAATVAPSHVLKAIGLDDEAASNSLRLSFGRFTNEDDLDEVVKAIALEVDRQRKGKRKPGSPSTTYDEHGFYTSDALSAK